MTLNVLWKDAHAARREIWILAAENGAQGQVDVEEGNGATWRRKKQRIAVEIDRIMTDSLCRLCLIALSCLILSSKAAFVPAAAPASRRLSRVPPSLLLQASPNNDDHLDDLKPPLINWRRESILFGESPATQKNNNMLRLWRDLKQNLPPVVTGAYKPTSADENPIGGLFNMTFIRIPILLSGVFYIVNLVSGHPLIMDIGSGPFEVNPVVVAGVLYLMLL
jgi:hypothetical protein